MCSYSEMPVISICKNAVTGICKSILKEQDYEKYARRMKKYLKWELIILDDFLLHTITDEREIKILFELLEKRNEQRKSTIVCSQRDPDNWKAMILNDEVSANSIMKRATKHYTIKINPR